jgi:hypothetical protein
MQVNLIVAQHEANSISSEQRLIDIQIVDGCESGAKSFSLSSAFY